MRVSRSQWIRGALAALFFIVALPAVSQQPMTFDKEPLIIQTASGKRLNFIVEIADTNEERQRGLMYRKEMAEDAGMIFDFGVSRRVQMWMENTILPLDMLFVDSTGTIRNIKQNAVPYSQDIIDSMTEVKYVIELNAGVTAKLGIKPGDKVMSATTTKKK
ncbi:DUF192 domain-containing protein [Rhizobium grahamii]|uniref:Uncharacterized protein n=1 Tax=Rhizobium grahamii CCGE 502 TaxID=990285 RepID=S3IHJ3_9HYPH|nr:DUF192 domain-containing protein [Rhizobium grahamii]EPE98378.1 hypothetical protein RGCCGE502_11861 [Rhizobium grahamii CCGE 502]